MNATKHMATIVYRRFHPGVVSTFAGPVDRGSGVGIAARRTSLRGCWHTTIWHFLFMGTHPDAPDAYNVIGRVPASRGDCRCTAHSDAFTGNADLLCPALLRTLPIRQIRRAGTTTIDTTDVPDVPNVPDDVLRVGATMEGRRRPLDDQATTRRPGDQATTRRRRAPRRYKRGRERALACSTRTRTTIAAKRQCTGLAIRRVSRNVSLSFRGMHTIESTERGIGGTRRIYAFLYTDWRKTTVQL
jgi:hypothetical protein